ncbi:hypothetical protein F5884DRAFT_787475 [Xylogone sp. PMI_703]|nr:hypothetical protein F5884DRAFT_787475 [Xylogone sp. PMI_703]
MSASSIYSTTSVLSTYARKMAHASKPGMEIILDNHSKDKIYTNADPLSGRVQITAANNSRFDVVEITLEGSTKTFVESLSPTTGGSRTTARHNFLKLVMPIPESEYPHPRIAEAGRTYTFPFNFVIPQHLLPSACTHNVEAEHVHHAHLQLPPSMGDREHSPDDFAPDMAKVRYVIKARVVRSRDQDGKEVVLAENTTRINVLPTLPAAPPMSIGPNDSDYSLSRSKTLKKGVFSGKLGKITVSAAQPAAFVLPPATSTAGSATPVTTMTKLDLRFEPRDSTCQPPRLGGLTSKIKVLTFYSVRPAGCLAARAYMITDYEAMRGVYSTTVPLSSRCMESVAWTKHESQLPDFGRRPSAVSTSSSSSSERSDTEVTEGTYYTASIVVPLTLPSSKSWIPTFHSCTASRIYALDLNLSIHTPGTGVPSSNVVLKIPVQIASEGRETETLSAVEQAQVIADAEEHLRPRVIEIPREELIGTSVLRTTPSRTNNGALPPSYEDIGSSQQTGERRFIEPGKC